MFHLSAWLATKRRQINRDDWPFASGSSDLVSQAVGVAPAITRYKKRKKNQDWLVIDRFNVHSTLRVQSSDAFLYNNCFRNIFRSCWTRNKSRAFCYERTVFQSSLSLIGIMQTQNLSWEWHLNISIIIFLVAWIQFFFSWNINHSFNILNGQKYKYKSSHNFNLNVNAIGTPSLRCNQNSHFSVFQSLTRYSLHNILLHGT